MKDLASAFTKSTSKSDKPEKSGRVMTGAKTLFSQMGIMYSYIVSRICPFDEKILRVNSEMIIADAPCDERKVTLEMASFTAQHFASLLSMAVLNYNGFRDMVMQALDAEIALYNIKDEKQHTEMRKKQQTAEKPPVTYTMDMGISQWADITCANLIAFANDSFSKHEKDFLSLPEPNFSDEDKKSLSVIFSNYGFVTRALNYNTQLFANTVAMTLDFEKKYFK